MLTIGSLFSGIGGLELGLEMAGLGPVVWQVEKDPFCRSVLAKHWPEVARFNDVRSVGREQLSAVDVVCGGFPCQDVSSAGKGAGLAGERSGLWSEFARVVGELRPGWVVVENVSSGAHRWLDAIVCELEKLRYAALPVPLSAFDVGAPHRRSRVFVVAHTNRDNEHVLPRHAEVAGASAALVNTESERRNAGTVAEPKALRRRGQEPANGHWWSAEPALARVAYGVPDRVDRNHALGNAVVPDCAEVVGWVIRELAGLTEAA